MEDPVVEEVRRIREEHAASFNYDVLAIFEDLKRIGTESGQPRVSFGPKRLTKAAKAAKRPTAILPRP